jgi:hypothetical protein
MNRRLIAGRQTKLSKWHNATRSGGAPSPERPIIVVAVRAPGSDFECIPSTYRAELEENSSASPKTELKSSTTLNLLAINAMDAQWPNTVAHVPTRLMQLVASSIAKGKATT